MRAHEAALGAVLLLAATLAFLHLDAKSLWLDEAWSATMATNDFGMFKYRLKTREANMSLYYVLLRGWAAAFGSGEAALRSLSALFAVASVAAVYALGRLLLGPAAAVAAAFLLATNAFHVEYAHDARSYSLVLLLVTVAAVALTLTIRRASWRDAALYAAAAGASLYAHFFAAFALAAQALALPALGLRRLPWKRLAPAFATAVALGAPLALFVALRDVGQLHWIDPVEPRDLYELAVALAGESPALAAAYGVLCVVALALGLRLRGDRSVADRTTSRWPYVLCVSWLLVPPLVAYAISLAKPVFVDRYLIVCLPALVLLAGAGLARLPRPWVFAGAVAVVSLLSTRAVLHWYSHGFTEDYRGAARYVMGSAGPGDALIVYTGPVRHAFDYYRARLDGMEGPPETVYPRWEAWRDAPEPGLVGSLTRRYRRVWLVLSHHWGEDRRPTARRIVEELERGYERRGGRSFERVEVRLYGR